MGFNSRFKELSCTEAYVQLRRTYNWDVCTTVGWGQKQLCEHVPRFSQEIKCHSTDTIQNTLTYLTLTQMSSEP